MSEEIVMGEFGCKDGVYFTRSLRYQFKRSDAGRSNSRRPKQSNDCTVRALATARGLGYDEAYDTLAEAGRKCSRGFQWKDWVSDQPWASKISFPAIKGERRMNPSTFCAAYPTGRYICRVAKHVFAVVDGVVHDINPERPDRCIYTAWRIE